MVEPPKSMVLATSTTLLSKGSGGKAMGEPEQVSGGEEGLFVIPEEQAPHHLTLLFNTPAKANTSKTLSSNHLSPLTTAGKYEMERHKKVLPRAMEQGIGSLYLTRNRVDET